MRKGIFILFIILLVSANIRGQSFIYSRSDSLIYEDYAKEFANRQQEPIGELIVNTAKYFKERPYVASTLELDGEERLVVNLREFDCTTFVESCIALSLSLKSKDVPIEKDTPLENYMFWLSFLRYRNEPFGNKRIDGYASRLHYTSDWIYENEEKNILQNISSRLGGKVVSKKIDFMSTHPQSYKQLKDNADNLEKIKKVETAIYERNEYIVIPKYGIAANQKDIKDGDIIAFATSINGLDYSHIGIGCWVKGKLHFVHASTKYNKVVLEPKTLIEYCETSKRCTGISVLRVND